MLKTYLKSAAIAGHRLFLRAGLVVVPKHYYVPFADINRLRRTRERWARRSALTGVAVDLDAQVAFLRDEVAPFEPEYRGNADFRHATGNAFGPGFGYIEAQALHGILRSRRPQRIIEVGSGVSTYCAARALERNGQDPAAVVTCIEPYPSDWLKKSGIRIIDSPVEDVAPGTFDALGENDLLFIDSSHALRTGGDVLFLYLEILPRLAPGVIVQIHDIFMPYDYQRDADRTFRQWQETALLHAYLIGNRGVEILACLSHLHYDRPDELAAIFPDYVPQADADGLAAEGAAGHFPASLYLRTTVDAADAAGARA